MAKKAGGSSRKKGRSARKAAKRFAGFPNLSRPMTQSTADKLREAMNLGGKTS